MTDLDPTYADHRRAAALFLHFTDPERQNVNGLNAVQAEVRDGASVVRLVAAMLVAAVETAPELATPEGRALMASRASTFARAESEASQ